MKLEGRKWLELVEFLGNLPPVKIAFLLNTLNGIFVNCNLRFAKALILFSSVVCGPLAYLLISIGGVANDFLVA
jgi:hypothetical protein